MSNQENNHNEVFPDGFNYLLKVCLKFKYFIILTSVFSFLLGYFYVSPKIHNYYYKTMVEVLPINNSNVRTIFALQNFIDSLQKMLNFEIASLKSDDLINKDDKMKTFFEDLYPQGEKVINLNQTLKIDLINAFKKEIQQSVNKSQPINQENITLEITET